MLAGRAGTSLPILHADRSADLEDDDLLQAIEVRLRVSAGREISADFESEPNPDPAGASGGAGETPWEMHAPLIPGDEVRTYVLHSRYDYRSREIRRLLLRPTDAAGATFEIESIRIILRREHLASIPSGPQWQGLSSTYLETLVGKSPEVFRFAVHLAGQPWLDLTVGIPDDRPVTFRVTVAQAGREVPILEHTVSRPHRWERAPVDLLAFAGQDVTLSLSLVSESSGALGFWGAPVVRDRTATEQPGNPDPRFRRPPRGIILMVADTLRSDHLDLYGYGRPTAPHLAQIASEGAMARSCVAQATWTKASMPSLLTSLYPASHGVLDFNDRLPVSALTLPEILRQTGYATLGLSSISFVGKETHLEQGFEEFHESESLPVAHTSKTSRDVVDQVLPWIEAHRQDPFFVLMHVADPHSPYRPQAPYDGLWSDRDRGREHDLQLKAIHEASADPATRASLVRAGIDPERFIEIERAWYDGSIRAMDVEIGRLIERLRALGLERDTVLVFTSDHGEEFLEHGRTFHGQTVYGELSNVPLILWGPGRIPPGRVIETTVQTIDVMPTILELAGLPVPAALEGHSLMSLLEARSIGGSPPERSSRAAFCEKNITRRADTPPPIDTESYAIVRDRWKLIHNTRRPDGASEFELYDTEADPLDLRDRSAQYPERVRELAGELDAWLVRARAARLTPDEDTEEELSAEEMQRLKSLGYVK
jgi:arylsulfatase A-like enzyme